MAESSRVTLYGGPRDGDIYDWPVDNQLMICTSPQMNAAEFLAKHEGLDPAVPVKVVEYAYRRDETSPHRFLYVGERQAEDPLSGPVA